MIKFFVIFSLLEEISATEMDIDTRISLKTDGTSLLYNMES
jgi:hypothetical protein